MTRASSAHVDAATARVSGPTPMLAGAWAIVSRFRRFLSFWSGIGGSGGRASRSGAAMLVMLGALLGAVGAPARAEALVSNIDLTAGADLSLSDTVRVQEFTAGDEDATLGGIEIKFSSGSDKLDAPAATLRRWDGSSYVLVAELAGPGKLAAGDNEFAAPGDTALEAGVEYAVHLEGGGAGVALRGTADDSESGRDGWSIHDDSLRKESGASSYETSAAALMIRVNEAGPGHRYDPFEPPPPPILWVSETTSDDGTWTVSWSDAGGDDFYVYVVLVETSPGGGSSSEFFAPVLSTTITGKRVEGDYSYRARGCRNICSDWSGTRTVTFRRPNSRPVVTPIPDKTAEVGVAATVRVEVEDADSDDEHTLIASSSNEAVARVSPGDGTLTLEITGVAVGEATITVTATDDSGAPNAESAAVPFGVRVPPPVPNPLDVPPSNATGSYEVSWGNSAGATRYELQEKAGSGAWAPPQNTSATSKSFSDKAAGTYMYRVRACAGASNCSDWTAPETVLVSIEPEPANSRPVVLPIPDQTVPAGENRTVTVTVEDADEDDEHTLTASSSNRAVATVSPDNGALTLTLTGAAVGEATISVTATDDSGEPNAESAAVPFGVRVPPPVPNPLDVPPSNATGSYEVSWGNSAGATRYELQEKAGSGAWAPPQNTSATSKSFSDKAAGTYMYRVRACAGASNCSDWTAPETVLVSIEPEPANSRPVVLPIPDQTVPAGENRTVTVTVEDADEDDEHTLTASSSNRAVATVSPDNGALTLTLTGAAVGEATISVTATDDSGAPNAESAAVPFGVRVPPPVPNPLDVPPSNATGSYEVSWGNSAGATRYELQEKAGSGAWAPPQNTSATSKSFSDKAAGTYMYRVRACAGASNCSDWTAPETVLVSIEPEPANSRPVVLPIPDQTVPAGENRTVTVTVEDADEDDEHTLTASSSNRAVATVSPDNGALTLTLTGAAVGEATISVTATDDSGAPNAESAAVPFGVRVPPPVPNPLDVPPSNATGSYEVSWGNSAGATRYELQEKAGSGAWAPPQNTSATSKSFSDKAAGTYMYRVRACAGASNCSDWTAPETVLVSIEPEPANSRPVVLPIPDQTVPAGENRTVTVTVEDADEDDEHTLTASSSNRAVATVSPDNGALTLTIAGAAVGEATITVTATDNSGAPNAESEPVTFRVRVTEPPPANSRPVVTPISDKTAEVGVAATVRVRVEDADSDDEHTLTATSSNRAVATVSPDNATLTLTIAGVAVGEATIRVTATDDSGAPNAESAPVRFRVRVTEPPPANSRPVVTPISDKTAEVGVAATVRVRVEDADSDDEHTLAATSSNRAVATVSPDDETLTLTITGVAVGEATIRVTATDDSNAANDTSAPVPFLVRVTEPPPPNDRPVVADIDDQKVKIRAEKTVTVTVTDEDDDEHTVRATSDDTSIATVSETGNPLTLTGVAAGIATIRVTATDDSGAPNAESAPVPFAAKVPPPVPGAIRGPDRSLGGTYTLKWGASVGATSYRLRERIGAGGWRVIQRGAARTRTSASQGAAIYAYQARACAGSGNCSDWTDTKTVAVPPRTPGDIEGPDTSDTGDYTLRWGWSPGATSYLLQEKVDDGRWEKAYDGEARIKAITDRADGTYRYRVKACAGKGNCGYPTPVKTVTVSIPNSRPVVSPIADQRVMKGADHAIEVSVTVTDADERDRHTLSATSADDMIATVAAEGSTLTITGVAVGGARITVTATDDSGATNATSKAVTFMVSSREYAGELRANPNPSNDGSYTLSWDAREGHPYHILLEGDADASSKKVFYPGEALRYSFVGKAPGMHRYELYHCDFNIDDIPFTLTLGSGTCAGTDIPEVTVTVNAAVGPSNINSDTKAGATPYRTGVTQGGDAYVNVPIEPAPGVNGLAPMLSIDYGGGRDRELAEQSLPWDTLGYGWHLSGFSTIRRCFVNQPEPAANLLDTDNLCLDGEPLVLTSGTALQPDAVYRLLRERFVKVTVKGTSPHVWFEAKGPDGSVSEYGNTEDSQLHFVTDYFNGSATMEKAFQWSINKRTDAFDNSMSYAYHKDESAGVRHPLWVVYGNGGDAAVEFKYVHRSDLSAVMLGSSSTRAQAQNLLLREIRVLRDASVGADGAPSGTLVRAYRLQTETEGAQRRLDRVQLCGYDETGAGEKCLAPIDVDWTTPDTDLSVVVGRLTDSLGRKTEFEYGVLEERASHAFLFAERPFGNPPASIAGTSVLDGDDPNDADEALKAVVTKMKRADGLADAESASDGWRETSYAYQGRGRKSELGWGFLGFDATRSTDEASGVVTYRRYRMDFPHYGEVGAVYEYDGAYGSSGTEAMYQRVTTHAVENISHGGTPAAQTKLPRVDDVYEFHYEDGNLLGATKTDRALDLTDAPTLTTDSPMAPEDATSTTIVYHTATAPGHGASATWGAAPSGTLGARQRKTVSSATFENLTSDGKWVIGFANRTEEKHYPVVDTADVTRVSTFARSGNASDTLRPSAIVRFQGDSEHELTTNYTYDTDGNITDVVVTEGDTMTARSETARDFIDSRYPETLTNAASHSETLAYDARFGLVKTLTDANTRDTALAYDAFGRETRRMTPDGVVIATAYERCSMMTCAAVATPTGIGMATESVTPVMRIKETSETAGEMDEPVVTFTTWRYLDKLGRTIRTETESFDGAARVRRDTRYDARGRVRLASQPYYSNETAHYHEYAYDARGRVLSETRPDNGVTTMTYIVNSGNTSQIKATATEEVYKPGLMGTPIRETTRETVSLYNVMGELVSRTEGAGATSSTDKATVSIAYNGAGQPTTHTAAGSATTFGYDSAGFRESVTSPNFGTVTSTYTKFGELHRRTDGKGTTTWSYDALGRATKREDPDGVAEWSYDPTNAVGALESRCYERDVTACSATPGFKETLAYNSGARVRQATTKINAGGHAKTYDHVYTYYDDGRLKTAAYPSELTAHYEYNARGYRTILRKDSSAGATLETRSALDARGNVTGVTYGNGVSTTRIFDPKTGRAKDIDTVARGGTKIQDNAYVWRSDGLLESRASHVGGANAKKETFAYDPLGRLKTATTKLSNSATATRTLSQTYHANGNLKTKTNSVGADMDVSSYTSYGTRGAGPYAGPHAVTGATIEGNSHTYGYDADGNMTSDQCAATGCDDRFIDWNGRNLPERITVGGSRADDTPTARDEFAYGPDGARYHRKTSYMDGETLRTENTYYVGSFEELLPRAGAAHTSIRQTRVTDGVRHVKTTAVSTADDGTKTTNTAKYVDYIHKDHLGSVEGATDEAGARTRTLAHDPFGERRKADWTAALTDAERAALAGSSDPRTRGHTGHEHLDRTGFIHRGRAGLRPDARPLPEPGPAGGESGVGAGVERLQLRLQQPDELRRSERAVAGARGWGLQLGRRDVRRGRGRLRPGERGLHAPFPVGGHLLLRLIVDHPGLGLRLGCHLQLFGRERPVFRWLGVGVLRCFRGRVLRLFLLERQRAGDQPGGVDRRSRYHAQGH